MIDHIITTRGAAAHCAVQLRSADREYVTFFIFVVCCAVLFGFGLRCIVLFCLCMLSGHFFIYF